MGILISALPTVDTLQNTDVFLVVRPTIGDYKGTISQLATLLSGLITSSVLSVSNSDSTLTVTPTTGAVVASLNLANANTWLANQTFAPSGLTLVGSGGIKTTFASLASSTNKTITFPNVTGTVITSADTGTVSSSMLTSGIIDSLLPSETGNSGKFLTNNGTVSSWSNLVTGVSSVSNSDSSITLSPTTGAVIGSINLLHQNVWGVAQRINTNISSAPSMLTGTVLQLCSADAVPTRLEINAFASQAFLSSVRWEGTKASPMALTNGVQIGGYNSFGYNGAAVVGPVATFRAFASEDWQASPAHQGSFAEVATTASGGATLSVVTRWENDGGTTCPNTVTGGSKGAGTLNVSGGYYINNVAIPTISSVNSWLSNQTFAASGLILTGSGTNTIFSSLAASTNKTITFPNITGTVITDADTGTVSNTMLVTVGLTKGGTGQVTANASLNALLPAQSTASGKYLTSDGSNASWGTVNQTVTLTGGVTGSGSGSFVATVITNANLTGPITSVGNATAIASQTGTGTTFVMSAAPTIAGGAHTALTGLGIRSTGAAFDLTLASSEVLTAGRTLSVVMGDAARILTFTSNASVGGTHSGTSSGTNTGDQTITLTGDVTGSGTGSFVTTLATVNSNVGTFAYGSFTVNAKGLITAASSPATPAVLTANSFTAAQTVTVTDSATNTVVNCLTLSHDSNGVIAASYGTGLLFQGQSSTTADVSMASVQAVWTTATHASRTSQLNLLTTTNAGALAVGLTIGSGITNGTGTFIIGGLNGSNAGIWGPAITPASGNYAFACSNVATNISVPTGGTVTIGTQVATLMTITAAGVGIGTASQSVLNSSGLFTKYNNVSTAGLGVPAIYASGRSTGQTAAVASVATYTVGAADGSFDISGCLTVTTSTLFSITVTVTYTDETNTSRTQTLSFMQAGALGILNTVNNTTGAGQYSGIPTTIRCKSATAITVATAGTFTTVTYNIEATIRQVT